MGKYRTLGVLFDRFFRNDLNANFEDIDADLQRLGAGAEQAISAAGEAETQAIYATEQGDYANEKGLYASNQGDFAKSQGEAANNVVNNTAYVEPYNQVSTYQKNNIVSYNGGSYIAKQTTTGYAPSENTDNAYWGLLSRKGDSGLGTLRVKSDFFVSTEGQTVFNLSGTYDQYANMLEVEVGGVPQYPGGNFTETSSSSFTLSEALPSGMAVRAKYFNVI